MKLVTIIFLFSIFISYSQNDFIHKTTYKQYTNTNFKNENFSFKYSKLEKTLIVKDEDLNISKTFKVKFYESTYSNDGKYYLIAFISDISKKTIYDEYNELFTFFFDKKNGDLIKIQIYYANIFESFDDKRPDYFFTEKGKIIIDENN